MGLERLLCGGGGFLGGSSGWFLCGSGGRWQCNLLITAPSSRMLIVLQTLLDHARTVQMGDMTFLSRTLGAIAADSAHARTR